MAELPALDAEVDAFEPELVEVMSPAPLAEVMDMLELSEMELLELVETTPDEDVADSLFVLLAPVVVAAMADE